MSWMIQGVPALITGVTRCSVFQKSRGCMKSGQVLDDPGCAGFNTGVTRCSVFQKSRGFPEIWVGPG